MTNPPCRVCGRAVDDYGTCVCAVERRVRPTPPGLIGALAQDRRAPESPLGDPPCVCECGAQFAYIEGVTESRACCVFCSQRKRRERLAGDAVRTKVGPAA